MPSRGERSIFLAEMTVIVVMTVVVAWVVLVLAYLLAHVLTRLVL